MSLQCDEELTPQCVPRNIMTHVFNKIEATAETRQLAYRLARRMRQRIPVQSEDHHSWEVIDLSCLWIAAKSSEAFTDQTVAMKWSKMSVVDAGDYRVSGDELIAGERFVLKELDWNLGLASEPVLTRQTRRELKMDL
jgi:hypothetical protein